jgi:hypothetical protein
MQANLLPGIGTDLCIATACLRASKMEIVVFWIVTPCILVDGYRTFGEMYYNHFQIMNDRFKLRNEAISASEKLLTTY